MYRLPSGSFSFLLIHVHLLFPPFSLLASAPLVVVILRKSPDCAFVPRFYLPVRVEKVTGRIARETSDEFVGRDVRLLHTLNREEIVFLFPLSDTRNRQDTNVTGRISLSRDWKYRLRWGWANNLQQLDISRISMRLRENQYFMDKIIFYLGVFFFFFNFLVVLGKLKI